VEYSEDMPGGVNIHADIIEAINQVQIALIRFTDATSDREWIVRESEWCFKTLKDARINELLSFRRFDALRSSPRPRRRGQSLRDAPPLNGSEAEPASVCARQI
jgi:hypothetical protein